MIARQLRFPKTRFPKTLLSCAVFLSTVVTSSADVEDAQRWLPEFQPSTLDNEQQLAEMQWFIDAARPFAGMEIKVVSETITTHEYEAQVLAQAVHRNHRYSDNSRPDRRGRCSRKAADADAIR